MFILTRRSGSNGFGALQQKLANLSETLNASEEHLVEKQNELKWDKDSNNGTEVSNILSGTSYCE